MLDNQFIEFVAMEVYIRFCVMLELVCMSCCSPNNYIGRFLAIKIPHTCVTGGWMTTIAITFLTMEMKSSYSQELTTKASLEHTYIIDVQA
jgi:hypothetical protein